MSKKITLKKIEGGRMGDRLKTISSMLIWSKILNAELVWDVGMHSMTPVPTARSTVNFFSNEAIEMNKILLSFHTKRVYTKKISNFRGLTLDEVMEVKKEFDENDFDLFVFSGVPRIHFHHLFGFAKFRSEFRDIYHVSINWFNDLYWYDRIKKSNENISISIHIRRGDLAEQQINSGFDCDYYKKLITIINKRTIRARKVVNITIFCENKNNEDILPLYELENVEPSSAATAEADFHSLCSSDILIACKSGFSTMASYLCSGQTLYNSFPKRFKGINHFFNKSSAYPSDVCLFSDYVEFKNHIDTCLIK